MATAPTLKPFAIIDDTNLGSSSTIAASPDISQITLISEAGQKSNGLVTSSPVYFGPDASGGAGGTDGGTVTFKNAGVYQGSGGGWAPGGSTGGSGGITNDYFSATGNGSSSTVTFSFNQTETYFGFLWGSMNSGNTITFYQGGKAVCTCSASDIIGRSISGTTATFDGSYYAAFNISGGYDKVVFTSTGGGFEFADVGYSSKTFSYTTGGTTYGTGSASLTGSGATGVAAYDSKTSAEFCFLAGTRLATPGGEVTVEALKAGDLVLTAAGEAKPVRWIGVQTVASRFAEPVRSFPVRIAAGALDENVPSRDLLVSPAHALLVDGILAQAGALVNGRSITRETAMPETFAYYHVELDSHELLLAEGAPAESFLDVTAEMPFDNRASRPASAPAAEMALPRAQSARQVPAATRARLAARVVEHAGTKNAA